MFYWSVCSETVRAHLEPRRDRSLPVSAVQPGVRRSKLTYCELKWCAGPTQADLASNRTFQRTMYFLEG
jgi:hypothetical protein